MPFRSGPTFSKWTGLLLAGDFLVFSLSVLLGYLLGAQITGEQLFLQEYFLPIVILGLVYLVILYIGEMYNYYLDFRQRENIGQVILWALGAAVVALLIFCSPHRSFFPDVSWNGRPWPSSGSGGLALSFLCPRSAPAPQKKGHHSRSWPCRPPHPGSHSASASCGVRTQRPGDQQPRPFPHSAVRGTDLKKGAD